MIKRTILAALLLVPAVAFAIPGTVEWKMPTQNVDGSAIPATGPASLASTRVEHGACAGTAAAPVFGTMTAFVDVPAPSTTTSIDFTRGTTVCLRAKVVNRNGENSTYSAVVRVVVPLVAPMPPTVLPLILK